MQQLRQGDVLLKQIPRPSVQSGAVVPLDHGRIILAYGEVTGHAHQVVPVRDADLDASTPPALFIEEPDGRRLLFVNVPCALQHEEHGTIPLSPGVYDVRRQREYSPEAIRQIAD